MAASSDFGPFHLSAPASHDDDDSTSKFQCLSCQYLSIYPVFRANT